MNPRFYYQTPSQLYSGHYAQQPQKNWSSPALLRSPQPPENSIRRGFWWPEEANQQQVELPEGWRRVRSGDRDIGTGWRGFEAPFDPLRLLEALDRAEGVLLDLSSASEPLFPYHTFPVDGWLQPVDPQPPLYQPRCPSAGQTGGDPVFLLVHGFTGDPSNFYELKKLLANRNQAYASVLLPGHALTVGRTRNWSQDHWFEAVDWWLDRLPDGRPVVGVGLSMGGNLVLSRSDQFDVCVTINTPYRIHDWRMDWLWFFQYVKPYYESPVTGKVSPIQMLMHLRRTVRRAQKAYDSSTTPTLVMNSRQDEIVPPEDGDRLAEHLSTSHRVFLETAEHNPTQDFRVSDRILNEIDDYLRSTPVSTEEV